MLWIRFRKELDRARLIKNYFHLYHSLQIRAMIQNINTTISFLLLKVEFDILCTKFSLFFYGTSSFVLFLLLFFFATSIYLFIYFFIDLSIYVFIFSFIYLFICLLFIYLFTWLFTYLFIYLFIYLFVYLYIFKFSKLKDQYETRKYSNFYFKIRFTNPPA